MEDHAQREGCKLQFEELFEWKRSTEERLKENEKKAGVHDVEIGVLTANMLNLTSAMSKLTAAIWGMVISVAAASAGFVIWYIQTL